MRLPALVFEAAINPLTLLSLTTGSHGISLWLAFIFMNQPTVLSLESDLAFEFTLAVFFPPFHFYKRLRIEPFYALVLSTLSTFPINVTAH